MKAKLLLLAVGLFVAACASSERGGSQDSSTAKRDLEEKYNNKVGTATKTDFVQEFGPANWCRQQSTGEETCRFYKKLQTKWMGEKTDRTHRETYDEVIADFDTNGVLKSFKVAAQR